MSRTNCYICGCRVNKETAYECEVDLITFQIREMVCKGCCHDYDDDPSKIRDVVKTYFFTDPDEWEPVTIDDKLNSDLAIEIQKLIVRRTRPIPEAGDHPAIPYIPHDLGLDILELLKERLGTNEKE